MASRPAEPGGLWAAPHRPLFLAAALWAAAAITWWPLGAGFGLPEPAIGGMPVLWHTHEMLFGFAGAAAGGYLLTALPGWTGQPPLSGTALKTLALLWLLARLAAACAAYLPLPLLLLPGSGYFLLLGWHLLGAVAVVRNWRKLGFGAAMLGLGGADALFLAHAEWADPAHSLTIARAAVLLFSLLAAVIGGKAVPAFTRNWLRASGMAATLQPLRVPLLAAAALAAALLCEVSGKPDTGSWLLCAAAVLLLWHMRSWCAPSLRGGPLLAALCLAYLWLPLGLGLLGLARLMGLPVSAATALHAVTIGAMGGLVFAIAARAVARRSRNGLLQARAGFAPGAALIWLAAWGRLAASAAPTAQTVAAVLWCLGWATFAAGFLPALRGPPPRPVLSGRRVAPAASSRRR